MLVSDLPNLPLGQYDRASQLKKELAMFIDYTGTFPNNKTFNSTWLAAVLTAANTKWGTSALPALPATQKVISNGVKVTATVTGSGTTGVTPTIAGGVVTGLALS